VSPRIAGNRLRALVFARALRIFGPARPETPLAEVVETVKPRRSRPSALAGLTDQVAAFADEGATAIEIARRTGLARDAIALILHVRSSPRAEISAGRGTMFRAKRVGQTWVMDAR
jgi:hypothetical protein